MSRDEDLVYVEGVGTTLPVRGVKCPDCKRGEIRPNDRCDECGLSWDSIVAAADFFDGLAS